MSINNINLYSSPSSSPRTSMPVGHDEVCSNIDSESKEITKYIKLTSNLRQDTKKAIRKYLKRNSIYRNQKFQETVPFHQRYLETLQTLNKDMKMTNSGPKASRRDRRTAENKSQILCILKKSTQTIPNSNFQKMQYFFSKDENLSQKTRNQLTTLFPKEGAEQLEVVEVSAPSLFDDIKRALEKWKGGGESQRSIAQRLETYHKKVCQIFNNQIPHQTFPKKLIEKLRDLISEDFPGTEHEYPVLFDIKLLNVDNYSISNDNEENNQNTLGSTKRPSYQADLSEENPNKLRKKEDLNVIYIHRQVVDNFFHSNKPPTDNLPRPHSTSAALKAPRYSIIYSINSTRDLKNVLSSSEDESETS
jgi:hypothetical protein